MVREVLIEQLNQKQEMAKPYALGDNMLCSLWCGCGSDEEETVEKAVQVVWFHAGTVHAFPQTATFCPNVEQKEPHDYLR